MSEIQYENYVRNVRSGAIAASVLAARLEKVAPGDLTSEQRKALKAVAASAMDVQSVQSERDRLAPGKLRPVLDRFANDWSAMHGALTSLARLPEQASADAPIAAHILATTFPDGVAFAQLPADKAWSEANRRILRMENEGLGDRIARLVGRGFVEAVKTSTTELANQIGTGKDAKPIPSSTALSEVLAKFGKAVGNYGRLLVATVDEDDEASVARFLAAVAPIDQHRLAMAKGGGKDDEVDPAEPVITPAPAPAPTPSPEPQV